MNPVSTSTLQSRSGYQIDPLLSLGPVVLTVQNLTVDRFYKEVLGLSELAQKSGAMVLGTPGGSPLVVLVEDAAAPKAPPNATGLYHLAIALPTRADLARWFQHAFPFGIRIGQSDHDTHEAFYLRDPEDNGIEIYHDRPAEHWTWKDGQVEMTRKDIGLRNLLNELTNDEDRWAGIPQGTRMGHVHLRIAELGSHKTFYHDLLGFDITADHPTAVFAAAGGYHHHLGANIWKSAGGPTPEVGSLGLQHYTIEVSEAELERLASRLTQAGYQPHCGNNALFVRDPAGSGVLIQGYQSTPQSALAALRI